MKKVFFIIPAYNVANKISFLFKRIPKEILDRSPSYIVINDGSVDDTAEVVKGLKSKYNDIIIIDKKKNEGYAQAQKDGFSLALKAGADIVVLLHSDCQYAPEVLPQLLAYIDKDEADLVQGSRMMNKRDALKGGMPFYKFIANVFLSTLENWVYGLQFAEYHSGYMLYSKKALETIPFLNFSNTFHFDGEMLFIGAKKGLRVKEVPIPTQYADEVSHVKPIQYGFHVLSIMIKYIFGRYKI